MQLIDFKDKCRITRAEGYDEWDNPVLLTIYEGPCVYAETSQGVNSGMVVRGSDLFLPSNDELVQIGDAVEVETVMGRAIQAVVGGVRDVKLRMSLNQVTRISLKQTIGV